MNPPNVEVHTCPCGASARWEWTAPNIRPAPQIELWLFRHDQHAPPVKYSRPPKDAL